MATHLEFRARLSAKGACIEINLLFLLAGVGVWSVAKGSDALPSQQAYVKASNAGYNNQFGSAVAISGDTMVIGAPREYSWGTGINGIQYGGWPPVERGAAYVFTRTGTNWIQEAYFKSSVLRTNDGEWFGESVAVSGDTVVVGAPFADDGVTNAGSAYVFARTEGTNWIQQAKFSGSMWFGWRVALWQNTLAVVDRANRGIIRFFVRNGTNWSQGSAIIGTSNYIGYSIALCGDTLLTSSARQAAVPGVEVFVRSGTNWIHQAFLTGSNTEIDDGFGNAISLCGDTAIICARDEASSATGVNGNQSDNSAQYAGAAYIFTRSGTNWHQEAYLKASNTEYGDQFGWAAAIWGDVAIVGAPNEESSAMGIDGNQHDNSLRQAGAAYVFTRKGTNWVQTQYLKASNTNTNYPGDTFGYSVDVSGSTAVVGSYHEDSRATGINGDQNLRIGEYGAGAAYVFTGFGNGRPIFLGSIVGGYAIRFEAISGLSYRLQRASNPTGTWEIINQQTALSSGSFEFRDTNAPIGQAFYRIAQE